MRWPPRGGPTTGEELTVDYGESFWETVRLHEAIQTFTKVAQGRAGFDIRRIARTCQDDCK